MLKPPFKLALLAVLLVAVVFFMTLDVGEPSKTIPITTRSGKARQYFLKGRTLADRQRDREATAQFELAVSEDPQFAYACLYLSRVHPNAKTSLNFLIRAEELSPSVSEGERLLIMASKAYTNRQPLEERRLLEQLVDLYPEDARVHNEFGNALFWQKDWSGAVAEFIEAIRIDPSFGQPYNGLGYCYRFIGDLVNAETYFLKYLELLPEEPNPYDSYADLLTEMGRHEEAIEFYLKAMEIRPNFTGPNLRIAWNYCALGEYAKAIDQLTLLLNSTSDPNERRRALLGLATTYADAGDFDRAASSLSSSCEIARESADYPALSQDLRSLGLVLLEAGRPDEASRTFTSSLQAVGEAPGTPKTVVENFQLDHMQLTILVWLARDDMKTSLALADHYLELAESVNDPQRVKKARQTRGLVELASGRPDVAIKELILSDLGDSYTQYHLARAYESVGEFGEALKYYRRASTYDQFNPLTQAFVRKRAREKVVSLLATRPFDGSEASGAKSGLKQTVGLP